MAFAPARPTVVPPRAATPSNHDPEQSGYSSHPSHIRHLRVATGFLRAGNSSRQIGHTVPSQPRAVQQSRP